MAHDQTWYERVRERISELGMSQSAFARSIELSPSRLGNYLQGTREPSLNEFMKIVSALGVTADWVLFGGKNRAVNFARPELASRVETLPPSARRDIEGYIRVHTKAKKHK